MWGDSGRDQPGGGPGPRLVGWQCTGLLRRGAGFQNCRHSLDRRAASPEPFVIRNGLWPGARNVPGETGWQDAAGAACARIWKLFRQSRSILPPGDLTGPDSLPGYGQCRARPFSSLTRPDRRLRGLPLRNPALPVHLPEVR